MRAASLSLIIFLTLFANGYAESGFRSALYAQSLLGPETWSRVIHIKNTNARSMYPRELYALIFEFADILWFYTERDGTQSFSLYQNRLAQEKADFGPGLLEIDSGFTAYSIVENEKGHPSAPRKLPNGCFIESLVEGMSRLRDDPLVHKLRLVLFYSQGKRGGHCILAYQTPDGVFAVDPADYRGAQRFGDHWPQNPIQIAQLVGTDRRPGAITTARTVEFPPLLSHRVAPDALLALSPEPSANAGSGESLPGHG